MLQKKVTTEDIKKYGGDHLLKIYDNSLFNLFSACFPGIRCKCDLPKKRARMESMELGECPKWFLENEGKSGMIKQRRVNTNSGCFVNGL